jgi:hypothetical protein
MASLTSEGSNLDLRGFPLLPLITEGLSEGEVTLRESGEEEHGAEKIFVKNVSAVPLCVV